MQLEGLGNLKNLWLHRDSNPRPSGLLHSASTICATAYIYHWLMNLKKTLIFRKSIWHLFNGADSSSQYRSTASNTVMLMKYVLEKNVKEAIEAIFTVISKHSPERNWGNLRKYSGWIDSILVQNRTENLPKLVTGWVNVLGGQKIISNYDIYKSTGKAYGKLE
jgi:hypothetical protein